MIQGTISRALNIVNLYCLRRKYGRTTFKLNLWLIKSALRKGSGILSSMVGVVPEKHEEEISNSKCPLAKCSIQYYQVKSVWNRKLCQLYRIIIYQLCSFNLTFRSGYSEQIYINEWLLRLDKSTEYVWQKVYETEQ